MRIDSRPSTGVLGLTVNTKSWSGNPLDLTEKDGHRLVEAPPELPLEFQGRCIMVSMSSQVRFLLFIFSDDNYHSNTLVRRVKREIG